MTGRQLLVIHLIWLLAPLHSFVHAQQKPRFLGAPAQIAGTLPAAPIVPLDQLPAALREKVKAVMDRPSMTSRAQPETLNCDPSMFRWLLDHPHVGVKLWQQLGARVTDIKEKNGVYQYEDDQGSRVLWYTALRGPGYQLWFAEGKVKPSVLLPLTAFRAIVVLHYLDGKDTSGKPAIRQQVHFMIRCDSRAVSLTARILGASMPRMAEEYLGQLQMFYGGMAWYLYQDAERARKLFAQLGLVENRESGQ